MARIGDRLYMGDDLLTFRKTAAETAGEYVEVECEYATTVVKPPVHHHPRQEEAMQVAGGTLRASLNGHTKDYRAGQSLVIPPGVRHSIWNPDGERTRFTWRTAPALRTEQVFETLWGLSNEGRITPDGTPRLQAALVALAFRNEYRVRTGLPFPLDLTLCALIAPIALARGYRFTYRPGTRR